MELSAEARHQTISQTLFDLPIRRDLRWDFEDVEIDYHMLEEAEHGTVSHDIFRYFCGRSYVHRVRTAMIALGCVRRLLLTTLNILIEDGGRTVTWKNWLRFLDYCLFRPGLLRLMGLRLLQYLSPFYRLSFKGESDAIRDRLEARLYATQPV